MTGALTLSRKLEERVHDAMPANHLSYMTLLSLLSIEATEGVETACVTLGGGSRLLINPRFVESSCPTDASLAMLVLHELYHILLGHTRLYPRVTPVQNLVFDAIINAQLCREFRDLDHTFLFRRLYRPDVLPEALLRPPPGWGTDCTCWKLTGAAGGAHRALYEDSSATYGELFALLERAVSGCPAAWQGDGSQPSGATHREGGEARDRESLQGEGTAGRESVQDTGAEGRESEQDEEGGVARWPLLLGDHRPRSAALDDDEEDAPAEFVKAVEELVARWPRDDRRFGRDLGGPTTAESLRVERARARTVAVLRRAVLAVADLGAGGGRPSLRTGESLAFLPYRTRADRRAEVRAALGCPSLLYRAVVVDKSAAPHERAHIYVDVSGSVTDIVPYLYGALLPLSAWIEGKVHLFSTVVADMPISGVRRGDVSSSFGTDIACVTGHMISHGVRRAVIVTDGYVGDIPPDHIRELRDLRVSVVLTDGGNDAFAKVFPRARSFQLPKEL